MKKNILIILVLILHFQSILSDDFIYTKLKGKVKTITVYSHKFKFGEIDKSSKVPTYSYKFNIKGYITESFTYFVNGSFHKSTYNYNDRNKIIEVINLENLTIYEKIKRKYDNNSNLIEETYYGLDGNAYMKNKYQYDKNNMLIVFETSTISDKTNMYNKWKKDTLVYENIYDNLNRLIRKDYYNIIGIFRDEIFDYDKDNKILFGPANLCDSKNLNDHNIKYTYKDNKLIEEIELNLDNTISGKKTIEYQNDIRFEIYYSYENDKYIRQTITKYDKNDNISEFTQYDNSEEPTYFQEWIYTYY